jgi:type VI secretion system protein ImpE
MNATLTDNASLARDYYKSGELHKAIDAQMLQVKAHPADQGCRMFLFELCCFAGEWERAKRQIDAISCDEVELAAAVAGYRKLLDAEALRRQLFSSGTRPKFLGEAPEHVLLRLQAVDCLKSCNNAAAAEMLRQACDKAPAIKGELNDKPFECLCDADEIFGTVLEVMSPTGAYFWLPMEQIERLTIEEPRYPRDLLWLPAHLELKNGPNGDVFLPAMYPGSCEQIDEQVQLGRVTDWQQAGDGPVLGNGARTFLCNDDGIGLLEWRELAIA